MQLLHSLVVRIRREVSPSVYVKLWTSQSIMKQLQYRSVNNINGAFIEQVDSNLSAWFASEYNPVNKMNYKPPADKNGVLHL